MSRNPLVLPAAVLFCAAWWAVWFSLPAFGLLLAASAAAFLAGDAVAHVRQAHAEAAALREVDDWDTHVASAIAVIRERNPHRVRPDRGRPLG
ncbi:Uncharacterised protein [Mycolicibacterium vanbaalenii]|uniref:Uncharacterized protein n=1 Tax=Mycolicibacterium vanbaalenii TaxID=110539 RepID=A0A5S9R704_MYCVN|nr:hypothetical protein [Mycolicibacterium vanbaalenii]CAA0129278.1 Uncharacterised protein [Mycolicibacterium vanbaalenii]